MDFDLTEEQRILKKSAHDLLSKELSHEVIEKLEQSEEGYSPEQWRKMAELGWMGLILPEEHGGSDWSFLDLTILLEEMGYNICPGPFFSSVVLGSLPILAAGSKEQKEELLPKLAAGEMIVTFALNEAEGGYDASSVNAGAVLDKDEYILNGSKLFVPDAHVADFILFVGRTNESAGPEEGITIFIVDAKSPGISITPLKTLTREKQCEVVFEQVRVPGKNILGDPDKGWPLVQDILEKAALARSAEMLGGAQAVMDIALSYALDRVQFDHPIGSFQAIQHYFADMLIGINGCRNLLQKAAWKISEGIPAAREVAMTKARTGDVYRRVTTLGHQIFGAVSFSTEHTMHLYHRRSVSSDLLYGDADYQREKIAQELGL